MKVTVAVDLTKTTKQEYVDELRQSGVGDITRSVTVDDNTTPETIEIEVNSEEEFDQVLTSDKVAGAQSDRLHLRLKTNGSRSITPNTTSSIDISHHN